MPQKSNRLAKLLKIVRVGAEHCAREVALVPLDFGKLFGQFGDGLGKHGPDPLLAFALFVALLGGLAFGYNPWVLMVGVVIIWGGYHIRRTATERHLERLAEKEVEKIEATKGKPIKDRYRQRIGRSPSPPKLSGSKPDRN